jgi:hypothetical protein
MGGMPPFGYDVGERALIVNDGEARTVRLIFERYRELGVVRLLQDALERDGIRTKRRTSRNGNVNRRASRSPGAPCTPSSATGSIWARSPTRGRAIPVSTRPSSPESYSTPCKPSWTPGDPRSSEPDHN